MYRLLLAAHAGQDIDSLLAHTAERFGDRASQRYVALISQALADVASEPLRTGSIDRSELGEGLRSFHLRHSRERALRHGASVKHPRHLLIYRHVEPETVEVVRILHDSMDFSRHLPAGDDAP